MARINPVERNANPKTRELLDTVEKKMGMVPNMIATMAQSPAVVQAYLEASKPWPADRFPTRCGNRSRLRSAKPISATTACRPTPSSEARPA